MRLVSQPFKTKSGCYVFVETEYAKHYGCYRTRAIEPNEQRGKLYYFNSVVYEEKISLTQENAKKIHEEMIKKYKNEEKEKGG